MFHVSERNGFSLSASRRFAVSDTACCSFLTLQRYYISIAVYEYISKIILSIFVSCAVIWSFGHLSKSKTDCQNRHYYNKYIYLFNSEQNRVSEIENDHFDLDHLDHTIRDSQIKLLFFWWVATKFSNS